jgi:hypothetical protein
METKFVELKDVTVDARSIVAYGKVTIPQTMQTPEMYALTIWLADVPEPITATYAEVKERDEQLHLIKTTINSLVGI